MKIERLAFKNYKAFEYQQNLKLRPITILIGKNSSGKSSIAKLFTLLQNSLAGSFEEPLLFVNKGVELGGEFLDLVHNKQPSVPVDFAITFNDGRELHVSVVQVIGDINITILKWKYTSKEISIELTYNPESGYKDAQGESVQVDFKGFKLVRLIDSKGDLLVSEDTINFELDVDYIGPFRILPKRQFNLTGQLLYNNTGVKGENAYPILGVSKVRKQGLDEKVGEWYESNFGGWKLSVEDSVRPLFQIVLSKGETRMNLVDVGQGMNQALPLVVRANQKVVDSLIILEQPELHLHPAAHASLCELFARSSKEMSQNFLIETHSENFILRLRKLIVENDFGLTSDDVVIYYVNDTDPKQQSLVEITVDQEGVLSDWPRGVFNENLSEIQEMMKAIKRKQENDS